MNVTEIHDYQFGRLFWDGSCWCTKATSWDPRLMIGLCLYTHLTKNNTIPNHVRTAFEEIKRREKEYLVQVSGLLLDGFNQYFVDFDDKDKPAEWPFNSMAFENYITLSYVQIIEGDECELQYITGGPLLRVIITPELNFKDAYFD